jgi:hypothetical protein
LVVLDDHDDVTVDCSCCNFIAAAKLSRPW